MATLKRRNPFEDKFFEENASAGPIIQSAPSPTSSPADPVVKKPGGQRLNIDIDPPLHKALKRRAVEEDRTVSDILRELIEHYLGQ